MRRRGVGRGLESRGHENQSERARAPEAALLHRRSILHPAGLGELATPSQTPVAGNALGCVLALVRVPGTHRPLDLCVRLDGEGTKGVYYRLLLHRGLVDAEPLNEGALCSHVLYSLGRTRRQYWFGVPGALDTMRAV